MKTTIQKKTQKPQRPRTILPHNSKNKHVADRFRYLGNTLPSAFNSLLAEGPKESAKQFDVAGFKEMN